MCGTVSTPHIAMQKEDFRQVEVPVSDPRVIEKGVPVERTDCVLLAKRQQQMIINVRQSPKQFIVADLHIPWRLFACSINSSETNSLQSAWRNDSCKSTHSVSLMM